MQKGKIKIKKKNVNISAASSSVSSWWHFAIHKHRDYVKLYTDIISLKN